MIDSPEDNMENSPFVRLNIKNNRIALEEKTFNFFHFGCWNKEGCKTSTTGEVPALNHVVNNIISSDRDVQYKFGIINGDNIYPNKNKTITDLFKTVPTTKQEIDDLEEKKQKNINIPKKVFSSDKFNDGFNCISKINKPLHVTLGNHDVENCDIFEKYKKEIDKNITVYDTGSLIVRNKDTYSFFIFINTNFSKSKSKFYKNDRMLDKTCYEQRLVEYDKYLKEKKQVCEFLSNKLESIKNCDIIGGKINVFVVGHHPLIAIKIKKDKNNTDIIKFDYYKDMKYITDIIMESNINFPVYYLAADIHNYQNFTIKNNQTGKVINVICAGTGGAEPDIMIDTKFKEFADDPKNRNILEDNLSVTLNECSNSYGYTVFTVTDLPKDSTNNSVTINYVHVPIPPSDTKQQLSGGSVNYYKKYKKYKNKYMTFSGQK